MFCIKDTKKMHTFKHIKWRVNLMNNDMVNNSKPHINAQKMNLQSSSMSNSSFCAQTIIKDSASMDNSMQFLGTIGKALVRRNEQGVSDSIKKSVEEFMNNQEYDENYISFSDSLIEKGYDAPKAILKTDEIFDILKNKETYN